MPRAQSRYGRPVGPNPRDLVERVGSHDRHPRPCSHMDSSCPGARITRELGITPTGMKVSRTRAVGQLPPPRSSTGPQHSIADLSERGSAEKSGAAAGE